MRTILLLGLSLALLTAYVFDGTPLLYWAALLAGLVGLILEVARDKSRE